MPPIFKVFWNGIRVKADGTHQSFGATHVIMKIFHSAGNGNDQASSNGVPETEFGVLWIIFE
jgi:hypothetical protein